MSRKRVFTLPWAGLRITAEKVARHWKASVYDISSGVFVFQAEESGPEDAKTSCRDVCRVASIWQQRRFPTRTSFADAAVDVVRLRTRQQKSIALFGLQGRYLLPTVRPFLTRQRQLKRPVLFRP